ncbi:MAG: hypothetical protein V4658_14105 [Bacteroidota bacterium]
MRNEILNREQSALMDFDAMSSPQLLSFKNCGECELADFLEAYNDACSLFGLSELYFRQAGRIEEGTGETDLITYYTELGTAYNEKGIGVLTLAIAGLQAYVDSHAFIPPGTPANFTGMVNEFKFYFENMETKPSDTAELVTVLNETITAVSVGEKASYEYLLTKANELKIVRLSPDRGASTNLAWWKIVAIAVYIGLAAIEIWLCILRSKGCSKVTKAALKAGQTIAALVMKFC